MPENWPPETLADALPLFLQWLEAAPDAVGWFGWYAVTRDGAVLVGGAGFKGPPRDGAAETGYSVLPQFQGRGYATEMVATLLRWAFDQPGVSRVVAEVEPTNLASRRVLEKLGFAPAGAGAEPGHDRVEVRSEPEA